MKLTTKQKRWWKIAKFFILFNLLAIPMHIILYFNLYYIPLQKFVALLTYNILRVLGFQTEISMYILKVVSFQGIQIVEISMDSTGWKSLYALVALVIATPDRKWKEKIKFLIFALPVIFGLNVLRIATTIAMCATYGLQYFEIIHTLLWREGLILVVVAVWYIWLRRINYNIVKNKLSFR